METSKIRMGNDEFILYIRKNSKSCSISNNRLGLMIWEWLCKRGGLKIAEDHPCLWGHDGANIGDLGLPKTAAQFEFEVSLLPELYKYLDSIIVNH